MSWWNDILKVQMITCDFKNIRILIETSYSQPDILESCIAKYSLLFKISFVHSL